MVRQILSTNSDYGAGKRICLNRIGLALAAISLFLAGCAMVQLKEEVKQSLASTVLVGQIATGPSEKGKLVVVAYSLQNGERTVAQYAVLHGAGEYELMVAEGNYYVCAYWDHNSNLIYDAGEPAGQYGEPKLVAAPAGGVVLEINFVVPDAGSEIDLPQGFGIAPDKPRKLLSR